MDGGGGWKTGTRHEVLDMGAIISANRPPKQRFSRI